jgi:hypothetical protein
MIAAFALLLAAPGRILLFDDTVEVPARQQHVLHVAVRQPGATVECRFEVERGGSGVRLAIMEREQVARRREGRAGRAAATTAFARRGALRFTPRAPGDYAVVLDNTLEGRGPAGVRVMVTLILREPGPQPRVLSGRRRALVVLLSAAFFLGIAFYAGRRLRSAFASRPEDAPPGV